MKKVLICLILSLIISQLYSQFDFRPGCIIMNSGDSIYGLIDLRSDFSNCQHIYFKNDSNSNRIEYFPDHLKAYYFIDGKYYVTKDIKLQDDEKKVFLELLLLGKVNLLYGVIEDENTQDIQSYRKHLFFVEKDTNLIAINNDIITQYNSTGKTIIRNSNQYKGVLKLLFSDCPEIYKPVDYVDFSQEGLISITKDYHDKMCPDIQCIIYEKPKSKRKYYLGVEYNFAFPGLNFYSSEKKVFSNSSPEKNFSIGVFGATHLDNNYRVWFHVNMKYLYQSYNDSGLFINVYPAYYEYKVNSVQMELLLKYRFSLAKLKPYFSGGLIIGYITNDQFQVNYEVTTRSAYAYDEKFIYGIKAGAGIEYSIFSKLNIYISFDYNYYTTNRKMSISGFVLNTGLFFLI